MEVSGLSCFSSSSMPYMCDMTVVGDSSSRLRKASRVLDFWSDYKDNGHLKYYYNCNKGFVRCGGNNSNKKSIKKKLKLARSLFKDLSVVHKTVDSQAISLQETAQALMQQLEELRVKEKELKRQKKEEKRAQRKSAEMMCSESSSSSESSDSDSGEVTRISSLRCEAVPIAQPMLPDFHKLTQHPTSTLQVLPAKDLKAIETNTFLENASTLVQKKCCVEPSTNVSNPVTVGCNGRTSLVAEEASAKKVEVCMGNKCKKSGGVALLEEFQRVLGAESAVIACKCMGKCRDGPNIRVRNSSDQRQAHDSVASQANPLCIGVGLKDIDTIVANFFGERETVESGSAS